ncbi:hypothetical protein Acsp02_38300 [Actinoplanes sp. NBRC 103695]|nr:hypothetical protein Acsp02_38300 [Actinoplanes sp. NBRC 103695]
MSPRRSGPSIDPPKPGPVEVLRLDLYVRLLLDRNGLGWVDVVRFMGARATERRKVSRAFEGGRRIPDWKFVEALVRCSVGVTEAEIHLSRCRSLHQAAQSGQRGPVVNPDEVTVELAKGDHEVHSENALSAPLEEGADTVLERSCRILDSPTEFQPPGRPRVEEGGQAFVVPAGRRTRWLEPLLPSGYGFTSRDETSLGVSHRRRRQPSIVVALISVFLAGYVSHGIGPMGVDSLAERPCSKGTVAARDLWLRDQYGATLSEVTRGQQVTIDSQPNPNGLDYRLVTADDGRTGWADARWIEPYCF